MHYRLFAASESIVPLLTLKEFGVTRLSLYLQAVQETVTGQIPHKETVITNRCAGCLSEAVLHYYPTVSCSLSSAQAEPIICVEADGV